MSKYEFLPVKNIYQSKLNWLFVIMGAISSSSELTNMLNDVTNNMAIPIMSALGIILRTYFTNSVIKK